MKVMLVILITTLAFPSIVTYAQTSRYSRNQQDCSMLDVGNLGALPPITSNMPYDVMMSWIASDSVCRTMNIDAVESFLRHTSDDTVKMAMKYYYRLHSYNPLALEKHRFEAAANPLYKIGILQLGMAVIEEYARRFTLTFIDLLMLNCSRVYTASVQSIYTQERIIGPDTGIEYCAFGIIDSVLKGDVQYDECGEPGSNERCIGFSWFYSDRRPLQDRWWHMFPPSIVEPMKSYLVFIHDFPNDEKSFNTRLSGITKRTGRFKIETAGVFEIVGGQILDPKEFFGFGGSTPLSKVLSLISSSRSKFMNE